MKTKVLFILLFYSIIYAQDDELDVGFGNTQRVGFYRSQTFWVASFPTSLSPHNSYIRYNGTATPYGQWSRVFATRSYQRGMHLLIADIDSFKIHWDMKLLDRPCAIFGPGNGGANGWSIGYNRDFGSKLDFECRGITAWGWHTIKVGGIMDTAWHTYTFIYNAPGVLNAYIKVASGDSLTATVQDTITNDGRDTVNAMCFGNTAGSFSIADTTSTPPAGTTIGMKGGLKNWWLVTSKSGRDTAYYYSFAQGYGDYVYGYTLTAASSLNAFRNYSLSDALSRGAVCVQSYVDYDRSNHDGVYPSSRMLLNGGFNAYDRYDGEWWDSTTNTRITTASKPYYIDTLGSSGYSGVSSFVTTANMNINGESFALGLTRLDSFIIVSGGTPNNINKTTVSGLGTNSFGMQWFNMNAKAWQQILSTVNYPVGTVQKVIPYNGDIIAGMSLKASGDSIKSIALTRFIARVDVDSSYTWKSIDSNLNNDVYEVVVSGNALMIGGAFTTAGATTLNRFGIIRQQYGQWQAYGTGANSIVWAIHVTPDGGTGFSRGDTIIGGDFTTFNGVNANHICKWNGTTAVPYGDGFASGTVYNIFTYKGILYATGTIPSGIQKWNGTSWEVAFGGLTHGSREGNPDGVDSKIGKVFSGGVQTDSVVIVVGGFTKVGQDTCSKMFMFNGRDIISLPWIDQKMEEVVTYNPPASDTLYVYGAGDTYGQYGVSHQDVFLFKVVFTK